MLFRKKEKNMRAHPRMDFFQPSYFIIDSDGQQGTNECWFYNISIGGIGIESGKDNLANTTITVIYKLGSQYRKDRLQIKYSNRFFSKWRYGCQFLSDDDNRDKLISYFITQKTNGK